MKRRNAVNQLVGNSLSFNEIMRKIPQVATCDSSILLTGETGTGKELIARRIHLESHRAGRPFVPLNCSALPEGLLESELFGFVRGAFTGAVASSAGLLEEADGSTVFLDEIGDMPIVAQAKLLRVLEEGEIRPVGGKKFKLVDIRFISATNKNLEAEIRKGNFRDDLFYRIGVINIRVPSLRERKEDIAELSRFFLNKYASRYRKVVKRIGNYAMSSLHQHDWPGNIRELENVIERAVVFSTGEELTELESIITQGIKPKAQPDGFIDAKKRAITKFEKDYIHGLLLACSGNISTASRIAKQDRRALHRIIKRLRIDPATYRTTSDARACDKSQALE